nr:hypothetical protein [Steroidobacter agaridevorans]
MTDRPEPSAAPASEECIHLAPTVEGDTDAVRLQNPVQICKGAQNAIRIIVVRNRPTFAVLIADTVGRIRYHEIDERIWQSPQYSSAITLKDFVDREHDGISIGIGGFADALSRSRRAERSIETWRDVE